MSKFPNFGLILWHIIFYEMCFFIVICRFPSLVGGLADPRIGGIRSLTICSVRVTETDARTPVPVTQVGHFCVKCGAGGRWWVLQVLDMAVVGEASTGSTPMWPTTWAGSRPWQRCLVISDPAMTSERSDWINSFKIVTWSCSFIYFFVCNST